MDRESTERHGLVEKLRADNKLLRNIIEKQDAIIKKQDNTIKVQDATIEMQDGK